MEKEEEFKIEASDIWKCLILVTIGLMIGAIYLIFLEYNSARKSCIEKDGELDFKFLNKYFCDDKPFLKYSDGWDWEKEFKLIQLPNISEWEFAQP